MLTTAWCAERVGAMYSAVEPELPVTLTLSKAAEVVEIKGSARGRFAFACSRCAEPAQLTAVADFEHRFVGPGQLDAGDGEFDAFDADPDVSEHDGVHLQLDELVIELMLLELPPVPLCDEQCKGLCPTCGTNFNQQRCACKVQADRVSPWAGLASFTVAQSGATVEKATA